MALSAAARIPEITLTIALTPMDWVYWGIFNDKVDGTLERPADGESAFSWRGKPLPYVPSPYKHPDYWNTCRGISRMKKRIEDSGSSCNLKVLIYDHCGHFIFPESMMKLLMPGFLVDLIIPRIFSESKGFVKECRRSRIDLDEHIQSTIQEWMGSETAKHSS